MAMEFPRVVFYDAWLANDWVSMVDADYLRQSHPVELTAGRQEEQGEAPASTLTNVLSSPAGILNPGNPLGTWYGYLDALVPVRWGYRVLLDEFDRTVAGGWDSTTDGYAWTPDDATKSTDGSAAHHVLSTSGAETYSVLAGLTIGPCEVRVQVQVTPVTGLSSALESRVSVRGVSGTSNHAVVIYHNTDSTVSIGVVHYNTGVQITGPAVVAGLAAGDLLHVAVLAEGSSVWGKVWEDGQPEPLGWQTRAVCAGVAGAPDLPRSGATGVFVRKDLNATTRTWTWDNFEIRKVRYAGDARLTPGSDETHKVKFTDVEASGLLTRANHNVAPAIEQYIMNHTAEPNVYWPLNDGATARRGRVGRGTNAELAVVTTASNSPEPPGGAFGEKLGDPWLGSGAQLRNGGIVRARLRTPKANGWIFYMLIRFTSLYPGTNLTNDTLFICPRTSIGPGLKFFSDEGNQFWTVFNTIGPVSGTEQVFTTPELWDNHVHHIGLKSEGTVWTAYFDGVALNSPNTWGTSVPNIEEIRLQQLPPSGSGGFDRARHTGHWVLYDSTVAFPDPADFYDAMLGHPGEPAGSRTVRLCDEVAMPLIVTGDPALTPPMGPQYPGSLTGILQECATTDAGFLHDWTGGYGLAYRTLHSTYDQDTTCTLDYSAAQVAPPLTPTWDDLDVINRVTATRRDGNNYTAEQTTGPRNTSDPGTAAGGIGVRDGGDFTVNTSTDAQLPDAASWAVHRGVGAVPRVPSVRVFLRTLTVAQQLAVLDLGVGDRLTLANMTAADQYDPVDLMVLGSTETMIDQTQHEIQFNTVPEAPNHTITWDDSGSRWDSDGSTLTNDITSGATSFTVTLAVGETLWTTVGAHFPLLVKVGGEVIRLSAVSGAASPQTFTVDSGGRAVNGVAKAHLAGAKISLAERKYWGWA